MDHPGLNPPPHVDLRWMSNPVPTLTFAKLYDRKTPLVAADLLNDRVIPLFDERRRLLLELRDHWCEHDPRRF